jgi:hypothetical protein
MRFYEKNVSGDHVSCDVSMLFRVSLFCLSFVPSHVVCVMSFGFFWVSVQQLCELLSVRLLCSVYVLWRLALLVELSRRRTVDTSLHTVLVLNADHNNTTFDL